MVIRLILVVALFSMSLPANAGFEEGQVAFDRGDLAAALIVFRSLAERGDARAQNQLGKMYADGLGVTRDESEAVKWYRRAAAQGQVDAENNLGIMYLYGRGVDKDKMEAAKWYRMAAARGYARSQNNLGGMYARGEGVAKDDIAATKLFRLAADQGFANAQFNLARRYYNGLGVQQDYAEAIKWYLAAADQGLAPAQHDLGVIYQSGDVTAPNNAEAAKWFRKAAEQGFAQSQAELGFAYFNGNGVAQDYSEAKRWFNEAANQGNTQAEYGLGVLYESGYGVEKDYGEAARWYRRAAKKGHHDAKKNLRVMATRGRIPRGASGASGGEIPSNQCPGYANALVLSGGGIKGAYQVGAIWYLVNVLDCDFSHFYGTSTGAVTAAFLSQAKDHDDLKALVNDLVKQYKEMKPSGIVDEHFLGKFRAFIPSWLGGTNGIYTLEPLAARLVDKIKPKQIHELTVNSVSLQTGRLRWTVSDNNARFDDAIEDDMVEPESIIDFVLGSASIPVVIEPRKVRFWVRGQMQFQGEDYVVMTSRNYGIPDPDCMIRVDRKLMVRCVYVNTKVYGGDSNSQWTTLLQIPDPIDREKLRAQAFQPPDLDAPSTESDQSQHWDLQYGAWVRVKPVLIEFSTLHQLVDGGVTDILFLKDLARMREEEIADTAFILTTGEYALHQPINNQEYIGGVSIGKSSLDHFLESYQFGNLESELKSAGYTKAMAEMLEWEDSVLKWRREIMRSKSGRTKLSDIESGLVNRFPASKPRYRLYSEYSTYPKIFLLMPEKRIFEDVFDARPEVIQEALEYGCRLAAGALNSEELVPDVYRATPVTSAPRCDELLQ